jgi:hypothetical protein
MDSWQIDTPKEAPVPDSDDIAGIAFTGEYERYTDADTWYPSWAEDGNLYSPYTDGEVTSGREVMSFRQAPESAERITGEEEFDEIAAETGQAKIVGDDPSDLEIVDLGATEGSPRPYGGRYPCGSLVYDETWYYGTYCLDEHEYNWDTLGPFVGFRVSEDLGESWSDCPHSPEDPIFGESGKDGQKVKIGAPHFVDLGQELEHSPDGKAYLVGHGATKPDAHLSWISGDQIYLIRVNPGQDTMNDPDAYEFFAGRENGDAVWSDDFENIEPLFEWEDNCGCVTMTYNPGLEKYLMWITHGWTPEDKFDTYVLEADEITGPWKMAHYMENFGEQAYFVNTPSKFISDDGKTAYLCYSNNFTRDHKIDPPGGTYSMTLQEYKILQH